MQGTVCFPPCLRLFPSGARARQLSGLFLTPFSSPASHVVCFLLAGGEVRGEMRARAGDSRSACEQSAGFLGETGLLWLPGEWKRREGQEFALARSLNMFCFCFAAAVRFYFLSFFSFPMLSCHFLVQSGACELLVPLGSKHPSFSGHAIAPFSCFLPTCSFSKNERSGNLNDKGKVQIKERLNTMFIDSDTFFNCILSFLVLGSIQIRNQQWGNTFKNIHPFRSVLK